MKKTILITGATDGIGLETAKMIAPSGHTLLLHGRSPEKLEAAAGSVASIKDIGEVKTYRADLSILPEVGALADAIKSDFESMDVLINNAGVFDFKRL
jgi:short-subunit dehydrogenase